jgi:hypothetical protein
VLQVQTTTTRAVVAQVGPNLDQDEPFLLCTELRHNAIVPHSARIITPLNPVTNSGGQVRHEVFQDLPCSKDDALQSMGCLPSWNRRQTSTFEGRWSPIVGKFAKAESKSATISAKVAGRGALLGCILSMRGNASAHIVSNQFFPGTDRRR